MSNDEMLYTLVKEYEKTLSPADMNPDVHDLAGVKSDTVSIVESRRSIDNATGDVAMPGRVTRTSVDRLQYREMTLLGSEIILSGANSGRDLETHARQIQNVMENALLSYRTGFVDCGEGKGRIQTRHQEPICGIEYLLKDTFSLDFEGCKNADDMYNGMAAALINHKY